MCSSALFGKLTNKAAFGLLRLLSHAVTVAALQGAFGLAALFSSTRQDARGPARSLRIRRLIAFDLLPGWRQRSQRKGFRIKSVEDAV